MKSVLHPAERDFTAAGDFTRAADFTRLQGRISLKNASFVPWTNEAFFMSMYAQKVQYRGKYA
jgi:hypothetical protein